jgi:hypothetical protein
MEKGSPYQPEHTLTYLQFTHNYVKALFRKD